MTSVLEAARSGDAWSLGSLIFGLESVRDDENRALYEERAPLAVRDETNTVLRPCPYRDERYGRSMNVSALAQITSHLDDVLRDVAEFRATLPPTLAGWDDVCAVLMDQLARPALYLLRQRGVDCRIPARAAVGYKLAIGYSKPLRELLMLEARCQAPAVSVANLHELVRSKRLLKGAREVCAAPMNMVTRVSEALLMGAPQSEGTVDTTRSTLARILTLQLSLGIVWKLFDGAAERRLLVEWLDRARLKPKNAYLARTLDERRVELTPIPASDAEGLLPRGLGADGQRRLVAARRAFVRGDPAPSESVAALNAAMNHSDSPVALTDPASRGPLAHSFVAYLGVRRGFVEVMHELELDVRAALGRRAEAPMHFTEAMLPRPVCQRWFEWILGYRLQPAPAAATELVLRNQRGSFTLPVPG